MVSNLTAIRDKIKYFPDINYTANVISSLIRKSSLIYQNLVKNRTTHCYFYLETSFTAQLINGHGNNATRLNFSV